ncbi:MAG: hypothetical protein ACP5XB_17220 [Isosphaeraceae bacterium]
MAIIGKSLLPVVSPFGGNDSLIYYHRGRQTLRKRAIFSRDPPTPEGLDDPRRAALLGMPFLHPFEPLKIGDHWSAKVGDDVMDYHLVSEDRVGNTAVVIIRREGRVALRVPKVDGNAHDIIDVMIERKGVTVFAYNRSVILEDRMIERAIGASRDPEKFLDGETRSVSRLVRSTPAARSDTELSKSARS